MAEVVGIKHGLAIAAPGSPDVAIVAALEDLLARVKAGEVVGVAVGYGYADNSCGGWWRGSCGRAVVGTLFGVATSITGDLDQN